MLTSTGAGSPPAFEAAASVDQANQTAIEAETNQDTYIPPDLLKHHPGVAKGWVTVDCTGTVTVKESYNVSSVTDTTTGEFVVNWNVNFSSAEYCVAVSGKSETGGNERGFQVDEGIAKAAGTCPIETWAASTLIDPERLFVMGWGDQ